MLSLLTGEQFPELRTLLSAGEELTSELLRAWLRPGLEIYNGYGPTECSIGSTFMRLDASTPLPPPIGLPKPNYRAYVLDAAPQPGPRRRHRRAAHRRRRASPAATSTAPT